jgi:TetR/AcrR family transcriptional regulator, regulator of mycofactocin system
MEITPPLGDGKNYSTECQISSRLYSRDPEMSTSTPLPKRGRPPITDRREIARTALELFAERGFEHTTLADVAAASGVGRRTLFRYFASKNDLVWGDFDWVLERLRAALVTEDRGRGTMDTLGRAVVASNRYEGKALEELRIRMLLITTVPALQAHSMVRYATWRAVVAGFVGDRTGRRPDDLVPLTAGYMALATSTSAFVRWVGHPDEDLAAHLRAGYARLARAFEGIDG